MSEKPRHSAIPRTTNFVFNNKGEILLIEFSEEKGKMAGFFDPPGGHIELSEGIIENAKKEILDESGVKVENTKVRGVIHVTNFFGKNIILFITTSDYKSGELTESREGKPMWVSINNLDKIKIFEDIKLMIKEISKDDFSVFTAKSEFDDAGNMIKWEVE